MNSNQVEIFLAAAKYNSFSMAAQELFISQSSISYQISRLETELKMKLFDRDSHEVRLTASGKSFYDSMLEQQGFLRNAIATAQTAGRKEQALRIGFSGKSFPGFGTPYIVKFSRAFPQASISVRKYRFNDGCAPLYKKEVDFLFTFSNQLMNDPLLDFVPIIECGSYLNFSTNNLLARRGQLDEHDLNRQTLLALDQFENLPHFKKELEFLTGANPELQVKLLPDLETLSLYIACNQGITISPFPFANPGGDDYIVSVPFGNYYAQTSGMAFRKDDNFPVKRDFISILKGKLINA